MPLSSPGAPLRARTARPTPWLALALAAALPATTAAQPAAPTTIVVTGNPLGGALAAPTSVLAGDGLALRRAGTLGETLDGLPGVAASGFGPQASRPVIRGLDGDRIRILDNGGASADASNLSFDHAVAADPLVVDRLEVLRGPAALLYGGNATGGVVNALDNRIPRDALAGLGGRAELRLGGAARETAAAAVLEAGAGGLNWHADVARRLSGDLRTPRFQPLRDGLPGPATTRVANSDGASEAAAAGASWIDAQGFAGAAVDGLRNTYGVAVDPAVRIRLRRDRLQLAGERRGLAGPFSSLALQASHTRYQHQELEGDGAVGTTFRSTGRDLRLQASQAPQAALGGMLRGALGLQLERLDFSALGDEAFVPDTRTRSQAVFSLQELAWGAATLQAGVRLEQVRVRASGDAADSAARRFGPALARDFSPRSLSLGVVAPLGGDGGGGGDHQGSDGWRASATIGSTQRAPAYYELFANGLHVATGAFERGDAAQQPERSRHLEVGLQWQQPGHRLRAALWQTRFANYIALDATGATVAVAGDGGSTDLPVYRFGGVPARLQGGEIEARRHLASADALAGWALDTSASLDWVRGNNRRSGQPLPRIAPLRVQAALEAARGAWRTGAQLRHAARQARVPDNDVATPGWTTLDLWASWQQRLGPRSDALWTLKVSNLDDALATNASALRTARALSPAGGRALQASVRVGF